MIKWMSMAGGRAPRPREELSLIRRFFAFVLAVGLTAAALFMMFPSWLNAVAPEINLSRYGIDISSLDIYHFPFYGSAGRRAEGEDTGFGVSDMVEAYAQGCLERHGSRIFWCGDELYIKAGREIPPDEFYEEYTQLENGVGMLRLMETEFSSALKLGDAPDGVPFSIATGVSAAPYFQKLLDMAKQRYPQLDGRVYPIVNDFFGHSINVTGLITGGDLIRQLQGRDLGERLFISQNMLRRAEMDFLDDVTLEQASAALGIPIYPTEQDGFALWDAMCGILPEVRLPVREANKEQFYRYNQN